MKPLDVIAYSIIINSISIVILSALVKRQNRNGR